MKGITLCSSLYTAMEEANFLLHYVWIHVLGSKYHPQVKQFEYLPAPIEVEPDPDHPYDMSQLSREEQEAASNVRSRSVHFTILARKTDNLKAIGAYQLSFAVHLHATTPTMLWLATGTSEVNLTNVETGEVKTLPAKFCVMDCMSDRCYPNGSSESRHDLAVRYFA